MRSFNEWRINEDGYAYNQHVDGPPFEPRNIMQLENQLHWFAVMMRTSFGQNPRFGQPNVVAQAANEIDRIANEMGSHLDLRHIDWEDKSGPAAV